MNKWNQNKSNEESAMIFGLMQNVVFSFFKIQIFPNSPSPIKIHNFIVAYCVQIVRTNSHTHTETHNMRTTYVALKQFKFENGI